MNDTPTPVTDRSAPLPPATHAASPTGLKIVVNGRTVVQRHFLQDAMDAMVRRALSDEPTPTPTPN